jgi:4-aminobutyrate aminotransferase-like enzyme
VEASLATLDILKSKHVLENVRRVGEKTKKRLLEMKEKYEIVGDVRGMGLFIGVEIVKDKRSKTRGEEEAKRIMDYCFQHGLLVIIAGRNVIRVIPPLVVTEEEMTEGLDILEEGIAAVNSALAKP